MEFEIGDRLPNGAILVAVKASRPNEFVVLAYRPHVGEYVTWVSDFQGETVWGHYFSDFEQAAQDFISR